MKYPLSVSTWDDLEIAAIQNVVSSGNFTMGENVKEFENKFAEFVGSKYCVMVNSGSSANLLMIASLFYKQNHRLKKDDEVIVPAVSWPTTYYPISQYGLKLRFVDIDLKTLNYNIEDLKHSITDKTKAIMVVNLLGNPNDFKEIEKICKEHSLIMLEDNCESMGAIYNSKQAGTFGLMGSFSSFFSHHISTMEGGMILTNDEELYHILLSLRAHGWTRNLPKYNKVSGEKSDDPFEESYRFLLPGYNVRPIEMSGAIGIEQLKKLPNLLELRRKNAKLFQKLFSKHPFFDIQQEIGNSSWFAFSLIIKEGVNLNRKKISNLLYENGIECRPIVAGNFSKNDVLKYLPHTIYGSLPNADKLDKDGLYIGNHGFDMSENINYLYNVLKDIHE
jgi:dTDP-4-amino-4,6-dideoxygalactose transaminase